MKNPDLKRRNLLVKGISLLGAATLPTGCSTLGDASLNPRIVDVHHHVVAPGYLRELQARRLALPPLANWSITRSLEDMDRAGVALALTSVTTPGVWFGESETARRIARECNDYGAKLVQEHPGRFGLFAALPLPDVDGSLREIEYAFGTLGADGVGLLTSFGDRWLGDAAFFPVLEELNRRKAVVYTHPTVANCCRNLLPDVNPSVIEFAADTSRAIASILFGGAAARYPDIQFIFSHAGGAMPFIVERYTRYSDLDRQLGLNKGIAAKVPQGILPALQHFYYDTAQASHAAAMSALLKVVAPSQVLFGTDFPFRTAEDHVKGLASLGLPQADLAAIHRGNARRLLPRHASA